MFDLVLAHTSFIGHTGYAHHSREFFTTLNKYIPVRVRNFSHVDNIDYLTEEQRNMIIYQTWATEPFEVGIPYVEDPNKSIINIVLNETNHYYFYESYKGPKIAYNVWESTRQPEHFFLRLLGYDQLWVPTTWQRECSIEQGFPEDRVKVVPEGLNVQKFCPGDSPLPSDYVSDRFRFIVIGRWDPRKSTTEIIRAFLNEFRKDEPVDLFIHVDNPFGRDGFKTTEERLAYYGFNDSRIKILRNLEKVENDDLYLSYLRNAHCFVSCARSEGWNIPLIQAIAVGIPTICSNYGAQLDYANGISQKVRIKGMIAARNVYGSDIPGEVAEPDFEHLQYIMRMCYENYDLLKKKALDDSEIVRKRFTWDNAAKKAMRWLEELDYEIKKYNKCAELDIKSDRPNLEYRSNSIDKIRCSYVLQYLAKNDVLLALKEYHRVLKQGGTLEIEVPDLEFYIRNWLLAPEVIRWSSLHDQIFGSDEKFYRTGFTESRLISLIGQAGFELSSFNRIRNGDKVSLKVVAIKRIAPVTNFRYNFCNGAFLEILSSDDSNKKYFVQFMDQDNNNQIIYQTIISPNHWAKTNIKYYINYLIKVTDLTNSTVVFEHKFNAKDQRVYISFESKCLGDTIAWMPYVEEFRKKHQCKLIVSTFWNELFEDGYPEIEFVEPGTIVDNLYAHYRMGVFDNDSTANKYNWRTIPLQKVASDILGLEYKEIRPIIKTKTKNNNIINGKYVVISQHSTFHCKYWLYPGGWQSICDYLTNTLGYKVVVVSLEEPIDLAIDNVNIIDRTGYQYTILDTVDVIKNADFFIGISSGPSWLAWALNVPTILISGYSSDYIEMQDCERILNKNVCHGCYSDLNFSFDRGNWYWCPRNKDFECSKSIEPQMVIDAIERILKRRSSDAEIH